MFSRTARALKGRGKEIVAAISIACALGLFAFIPALLTGIDTPQEAVFLPVIYALEVFFLALVAAVAKFLGIEKALFQDYAQYPILHWALITIVAIVVSVMSILFVLRNTPTVQDIFSLRNRYKRIV